MRKHMKILVKLMLASSIATSLSGCIIIDGDRDWNNQDWREQQKENTTLISQLSLQSSYSDVIARLGSPSFSDAFLQGKEEYRVLYYRTHHVNSDGDTTKDYTTPLVFKNDKLIGWGQKLLSTLNL